MSKYVCDTSCSNLSSCSIANKDIFFEPRRSKRSKKVKNFGSEFCSFLLENDSKTYGETIGSIDVPFWKEAINDDMSSLKTNKTWFLTNLPLGCKSIGCKWVFRKKLRTDGSIAKFKARLVVMVVNK